MTIGKMYTVTFEANGIAPVVVGLGDTPAQITGGYGGWTVTNRQRRVGLTTWEGKDPLRMSISVMFDGVEDGVSQEIPISRLSRMALPPTTGGEPPQVRVSGVGLPKPGPVLWVIENLQWGNNVLRDFASNGVHARLRQDCVVNLLEYRAEDVAAFHGLVPGKVASSKSTQTNTAGWPKTHTVKSGETLSRIAAYYYHDGSKWRKIADANNIRDPSLISHLVGRKIRIPAP